jgi:hypothetical protein
MGCGQSKEDAEGPVARCREQKNLLRAAVEARHALSGAHAGHAAALRNVGAALSDYASGEAHEGALRHSASAAAVMSSSSGGAGAQAAALALPPPPPPPGPPEDAPALVRSMSAPDLPLQPAIKKKPSGEAPIMEEDDEGEDPRRPEEEAQLQPPPPPPPPPPTQQPPPTRSPPALPPETGHKAGSWDEFIFGSRDGVPIPPPTLGSNAAASWEAERAEAAAPPPPPPDPEEQPQPPPPPPAPSTAAQDVAEGKKPAVEAVTRRALTQKGKKGRTVVMVPPKAARLGDILRELDEHFLKASDSAHEVSKMLEAARMHYHSNFAETRGTIPHALLHSSTWSDQEFILTIRAFFNVILIDGHLDSLRK